MRSWFSLFQRTPIPSVFRERFPACSLHKTRPDEARGPGVRIGYFDCFSGISGDMTLGALVDAGVDPGAILTAVESLGLSGTLRFETVRRGGFRATYANDAGRSHEHVHRHMHHIEAIIEEGSGAHPIARKTSRGGSSPASVRRRRRCTGSTWRRSTSTRSAAPSTRSSISVGVPVELDLLGVERFEVQLVLQAGRWVKCGDGEVSSPALLRDG